jgi:drug/metabolite transporter (DMT)-like permease
VPAAARGAAGRDGVRVGATLAVGAAVLWGTSWVATGLALRAFDAMAAAAWRGLVTAAVLLPLVLIPALRAQRGPVQPLRRLDRQRALRYLVLGALGGPGFVLGMTVAVGISGATIAAFVAGSYPVVAAAGAPFVLGERPSRVSLAGLALAFVGALLMTGFDVGGLRPDGLFVASAAAVSFAAFLLLARRWQGPWQLPATTVAFVDFGMAGIAGSAICLLGGVALLPSGADPGPWLAVAYLAVGPGLIGTLFVLGSVRRLPAATSSAFLMLNPLTAALLAGPLLGERLTPLQLVGGGLVLAGIGLATLVSGWLGISSRAAARA